MINPEDIFRELLMESIDDSLLLTESIRSNDIVSVMKKKQVIAINYEGEDVKSGARYIEIYAYGLTLGGSPKPCVLAYMRGNVTSKSLFSGRPNDKIKWRIYRLDRITSWNITKNLYYEDSKNMAEKKLKYNEQYNNLSKVFFKIPLETTKFDADIEDENENDEDI